MNKAWIGLLFAVALFVSCGMARADDGLLVDYNFQEGAGSVVHDGSGNGNDGTIQGGAAWVKGQGFDALSFNGKDSYIQGPTADLPIGPTGTLEFWCYPRKFGGGLITWCKDGEKRLSLTYDISWCNRLLGDLSGGGEGIYILGDDLPADVVNRWSHMVLRFDSHSIDIFRNGKLQVSRPSFFTPDIKGTVMRIGAIDYAAGLPYFDGLMAGVKVYNRALSNGEIAAHFARGAAVFQPYLPRTLTIVPRFHPTCGELTVAADLSDLAGLPLSGYSVEAQLFSNSNRLQTVKAPIDASMRTANVNFNAHDLPVGDYDIHCTVRDAKGATMAASSVRWRLPKLGRPGAQVLNNLVAQLRDVKNLPVQPTTELSFTNPRKGWIFVSCKADLKGSDAITLAVDGAVPGAAIHMGPGGPGSGGPASGETMCYLPEGPGTLKVECSGTPAIHEIVVRSIPELVADGYPSDYDFNFLQHGVLPNINTLMGGCGVTTIALEQGNDPVRTQAWFDRWNQFDRWKQSGRRWTQEVPIPNARGGPDWVNANSYYSPVNKLTADQVFSYLTRSEGFTDPDFNGLFVDELGTEQGFGAPVEDRPYVDSRYLLPPYTDAVRRMAANPKLKDRSVYFWTGANDRALSPTSREFVQAVLDAGYKFSWEEYMSQPPTERDGRDFLAHGPSGWSVNNVRLKMERANALYPGIVENTLFAPGLYSTPGLSHIVDPNLDFKVWMDMEIQYLATAPEFFGLDGIVLYPLGNADEESLRWAGQLFRHYAIEGKTDLLSTSYGYQWKPNIIQNPDFDAGLQGWTINAAEPGAVSTGEMDDLGLTEGRMRRNDMGRHFLLTKRCAAGPNTASQTLRNLVPGKLYIVKMLTTDYQSYLKSVDSPALSAHLALDGVEMIPDKSSITHAKSWSGRAKWFDSFRLIFRAQSPTAKLTISDWKAHGVPGGPVGQQLLFNFVAVTPYFDVVQ